MNMFKNNPDATYFQEKIKEYLLAFLNASYSACGTDPPVHIVYQHQFCSVSYIRTFVDGGYENKWEGILG